MTTGEQSSYENKVGFTNLYLQGNDWFGVIIKTNNVVNSSRTPSD
ncbi:hypothetical protein NSP_10030 [Nodularia spumigena CCY9414]|nr:hypothetical protein NSP_10030 [Nodularia spumigena CCY9414]